MGRAEPLLALQTHLWNLQAANPCHFHTFVFEHQKEKSFLSGCETIQRPVQSIQCQMVRFQSLSDLSYFFIDFFFLSLSLSLLMFRCEAVDFCSDPDTPGT